METMTDKKPLQLTQSAVDALKKELEHLEGDARTKVIDEIATARAHGDLSENAEYHAAREQQGMQEARVRQIREMLENAEIVESRDDDVVAPGKLVTIRHEGDDESETYLLGLREERKAAGHDVLTPESPLGKALLGKKVGEKVAAEVPAGELRVEVVAVELL
jgi:transcription elongation factor GreA